MLKTIFGLFTRQSSQIINKTLSNSKYHIAKSGQELLLNQERQVVIRKIKRLFSITDDVWKNHYLYAIEKFAELVQEVPASEVHHHSDLGGLLDHTLETLHAGVRISQGYILPPNSEPEQIASSSDRWRFGAFIAILAHDIGKVVTDLEVVYREGSHEFQYWHPWFGPMMEGAEYAFRFKPRGANAKVAKSLHEKAAISLLPILLTKDAARWIFEDSELMSQLFCTITHSTFGGHAIAEIVRAADMSSVAGNLGADTGVNTNHSSVIPLHEKLVLSLRKLLTDGELKRNKPGAAVWITKDETWAVSKAVMEAVRLQLLNEGHKGIPKNIVRLFEVLREHDLLIPNSEGDSVWSAEVNDFAKNWRQQLTFLRFKNEVLWPTSNPKPFDGELIPVDRSGKPLADQSIESKIEEIILEKPNSKIKEINVVPSEVKLSIFDGKKEGVLSKRKTELLDRQSVQAGELGQGRAIDSTNDSIGINVGKSTQAELIKAQNAGSPKDRFEGDGVTSIEATNLWKQRKKVKEETLRKNHFIAWMLLGIETKKLRVNEQGAKVHVLENHVAIVSPAIFASYFSGNPSKKSLYGKKAAGNQAYTVLQKEIVALGINQKGINGQNIVDMTVDGEKRKSTLKVFLLDRDCFPSLKKFKPNNVMKLFF